MEVVGLGMMLLAVVLSMVYMLFWRKKAKINESYWRQLEKENFHLRQGLQFYANTNNYETTGQNHYTGHGDFYTETWIEVDKDRGKIARESLEKADN